MKERLSFKEASYIGAGRILIPHSLVSTLEYEDHEKGAVISVLDAHKIYRNTSPSTTPYWWESITNQSKFYEDTDETSLIIKLPDEAFLVVGFYSESFFQWLETLPSEGVIYDRFAGGIIIENPEWDHETNAYLSTHRVQATQEAAEYISPITEQSKKLEEFAAEARREGYDVPDKDIFPSKRNLMSHQEPVVLSLAKRGQGILADDVGSGKSSMFLCGYFSRIQYEMKFNHRKEEELWPLVVVTQKSLVEDISAEADRWFNGVKVHMIKSKKDFEIPSGTQIISVPLSSLDRCLDNIIEADPKGAIFDESHKIKSMTAKRTQASVELAKYIQENSPAPYTVCASATPIPNRVAELWSQLVVAGMSDNVIDYIETKQKFPNRVRPSLRNNYNVRVNDNMKFDIRYCNGKPGYFGWDNKGSTNEEELSSLIYNNGFIRRRKFEFMTPLPLLHQNFIRTPITEKDLEDYNRAEEQFKDHLVVKMKELSRKENWSKRQLRQEIVDKLNKADTAEAIMKMTELRQVVERIKIPGTVEWIHRFFAKDPAIVGKNANKRKKLIVFTHHKEPQQILINHPELQQYGLLSIMAGEKNVNKIVDEFQDWDSGKNLIILYSGCEAGLTLTAAYDVLLLNIPFSFYNVTQMAGRCWARISELYPPHEAYIHYTNSGTGIDQYMIDLIKEKSVISKMVVDGESIDEQTMTDTLDMINAAQDEENDDTDEITKGIFANLIS